MDRRVSMSGSRVVVHVDLDAFYAQVEQVRHGIPASEPVVVNQWGMMIAVNYPARDFGIKRGERLEDVVKKCPACHVIHVETIGDSETDPANSKASLEPYRNASYEIMSIFSRYCPLTERGGMDEAFLDLTEIIAQDSQRITTLPTLSPELLLTVDGTELRPDVNPYDRLLVLAAARCFEIRQAVYDELGYTVSAGIGPNKMLAKLASAKHKPNKQTLIPFHSIEAMMQQMPMRSIRGLGRKLGEEVFRATGAQMAADLQRFTEEQMAQRFGEGVGKWLYWVCRGVDNEEVKCNLRPKSLLAFKSFSPVKTFDEMQPWLRLLCDELVQRIAADSEKLKRFPKTLVVFHRGRAESSGQYGRSLSVSRSTAMPRGAARQQGPTAEEVFDAAMSVILRIDSIFPCTRIAIGATDMQDLVPEKRRLEALFAKQASNAAPTVSSTPLEVDPGAGTPAASPEVLSAAIEVSRPDQLQCERCDERFADADDLALHMDWHVAVDLQQQFDAQPQASAAARSSEKRHSSTTTTSTSSSSPTQTSRLENKERAKKARSTLDWYYKKS